MARSTYQRPLTRSLSIATFFILLMTLAGQARAEDADFVDGRLTLSASYGFLTQFFQHPDISSTDPLWGHGVSLRFGGEQCRTVCLGLSVLGSIMVSPEKTGTVGVGPHIGLNWEGPAWGGPYSFRVGAAYHWLRAPFLDEDAAEGGNVVLDGVESAHGVGAWLSFDLELRPRTNFLVPLIGLRGQYVAVVSPDTVIHQLGAQIFFGLSLGRRLDFSERDENDIDLDDEDEFDIEDDIVDDSEDERRLRDAEDELRRMPGQRF